MSLIAYYTHNKYGNKACDSSIPVTCSRGLSHQHTVKDEVSESQLHSSYINTLNSAFMKQSQVIV